jgi:GT2 family glycosyltransferase
VTAGTLDLSVVVCSYNRADRLAPTLDALNRQTIRDRIEVVVVDDGSAPAIDRGVVEAFGARLVSHQVNRGLAPARNTGIDATVAPLVAFTDDDCRPEPGWAASLVTAYGDPAVAAAGGPVLAASHSPFLQRYYRINEPVRPLEAELGRSHGVAYRFWLYCRENVVAPVTGGARDVYSLPGANFSFRRDILEVLGGFDAGIRFGGEDEDICYRLRRQWPERPIRAVPGAAVVHDYDSRLRDALRRARAYGKGNARNFLKHDGWGPTLYPSPVVWGMALLAGTCMRRGRLPAVVLPLLLSPRWAIRAVRTGSFEALSYAYIQVLQEAATDVGFISGWWRLRRQPITEGAAR